MAWGTKSKLGVIGAILVFAICVAACEDRPLMPYKLGEKNLGKYGEFTGTHLIVRWPKREHSKEDDSVTLKIPAEYLNEQMASRDKKGINGVYIDFAMPGVKPWGALPLPNGQPEVVEVWKKHLSTRVLAILDRDSGVTKGYTKGLYGLSSNHQADGTFYGLERYTETICYQPEEINQSVAQQNLKTKPADDTTPSNCFLRRKSAVFRTPPALSEEYRGVSIDCMPTGCNAYFVAGGRGAKINFDHDRLPEWQERVEAARSLINSFVVPKS